MPRPIFEQSAPQISQQLAHNGRWHIDELLRRVFHPAVLPHHVQRHRVVELVHLQQLVRELVRRRPATPSPLSSSAVVELRVPQAHIVNLAGLLGRSDDGHVL
jgi:hypothetical protein